MAFCKLSTPVIPWMATSQAAKLGQPRTESHSPWVGLSNQAPGVRLSRTFGDEPDSHDVSTGEAEVIVW